METYNGLLLDKLPATFKWIYLNVQKARIGEPRSEGEVENQNLCAGFFLTCIQRLVSL